MSVELAILSDEISLDLDESIDVRVWDSNSELRYAVLPQRPPGTEEMDEEAQERLRDLGYLE